MIVGVTLGCLGVVGLTGKSNLQIWVKKAPPKSKNERLGTLNLVIIEPCQVLKAKK